MNNVIKSTVFFITFLMLLFINSCKKDYEQVPNIYVNFFMYLNDPEYIDLMAVGNSVYVNNQGVKGIIIYRLSATEFKAFDRCCTYLPQTNNCAVEVDSTTITAVCPCCESEFTLPIDAAINKGPASVPLKSYKTTYSELNMRLNISNGLQ